MASVYCMFQPASFYLVPASFYLPSALCLLPSAFCLLPFLRPQFTSTSLLSALFLYLSLRLSFPDSGILLLASCLLASLPPLQVPASVCYSPACFLFYSITLRGGCLAPVYQVMNAGPAAVYRPSHILGIRVYRPSHILGIRYCIEHAFLEFYFFLESNSTGCSIFIL